MLSAQEVVVPPEIKTEAAWMCLGSWAKNSTSLIVSSHSHICSSVVNDRLNNMLSDPGSFSGRILAVSTFFFLLFQGRTYRFSFMVLISLIMKDSLSIFGLFVIKNLFFVKMYVFQVTLLSPSLQTWLKAMSNFSVNNLSHSVNTLLLCISIGFACCTAWWLSPDWIGEEMNRHTDTEKLQVSGLSFLMEKL